MFIDTSGYNVASIEIAQELSTGVKTKVGSIKDFTILRDLALSAGVLQCKAVIGGSPMWGTAVANFSTEDTGVELVWTTNFHDTPVIVSAFVEQGADGCYVTVTVISIS